MTTQDRIEAALLEVELLGVGLQELDVVHTELLSTASGEIQHLTGDVGADDPASGQHGPGCCQTRFPDTCGHIQHDVTWTDRGELEQFAGLEPPGGLALEHVVPPLPAGRG